MTKKQRRDKESSAENHREKINRRRQSTAGEPILSRARRGTVNLARRCPEGKVSTKGRIVADSLPVASIELASSKFLDSYS